MKKAKIMSVLMAGTMIMGSTMPVFAATENDTDSVGSIASDITNETKVGQDVVQKKQSEYFDEIKADAPTNTCEAYLTKASTFSVVIPKTIVLDGSTKSNNTGVYSVTMKGNIGGDDIITVVPSDSFNLKQPGKKDVLATVTQKKQSFQINDGMVTEENVESGNTVTGAVTVEKITAGKWSGNFNFDIAINTKEAIAGNSSEATGEYIFPEINQ